jgi:signal recognition particle GTPase
MLISYLDIYYALNKKEKARKLASELKTVLQENLTYYSQYDETNVESMFNEIERSLLMYDQIVKTAIQFDDEDYATALRDEYVTYLKLFDFLIEKE